MELVCLSLLDWGCHVRKTPFTGSGVSVLGSSWDTQWLPPGLALWDLPGATRSHGQIPQELWKTPISAPNHQPSSFHHHKCGHQCTAPPVLSPALSCVLLPLPCLSCWQGGSAQSRQHCRGSTFDLNRFAEGRLEWWLAVSHFF